MYQKLVATNPDIEHKGATHPYTSLNGNMFSYLHPSGVMALRLPKEEREKFLKRYKTTLFEADGIVQKRIRDSPRSAAEKDGGTVETLRSKLSLCPDLEVEAVEEEELISDL